MMSFQVGENKILELFYDKGYREGDRQVFEGLSLVTPEQDKKVLAEKLTLLNLNKNLKIQLSGVRTGLKMDIPISGIDTIIDIKSNLEITAQNKSTLINKNVLEAVLYAEESSVKSNWIGLERKKGNRHGNCGKFLDFSGGTRIVKDGDKYKGEVKMSLADNLYANVSLESSKENPSLVDGMVKTQKVCENNLTAMNLNTVKMIHNVLPVSIPLPDGLSDDMEIAVKEIIRQLLNSTELEKGVVNTARLPEVNHEELVRGVITLSK
ncbi:hypothetical protein [Vibrio crassostreae]|uniref:hypothetical protein n=1 Tax=Vibrio crassostreae TaxID=246167 RepID=UPI001B308A8B|nr:hypothetical protein [Vibrio crassostreae]